MDDNEKFDLDSKNGDELIDIVYGTLETLVNELEQRGFPGDVIDATLFIFWQQRMFEYGDREDYTAILEEALEEEWPEAPTLH